MTSEPAAGANVKQAVPFFGVTDMERSLRFYVDGLGFAMAEKWMDEGKLRWCWLHRGGAALMLQEYRPELVPQTKLGEGVSVCFICEDAIALYHEFTSRGIEARRPFVGNGMWDVGLVDPDGYHLHFESFTDVPEETEYDGGKG
jgi:lactoylglutathione lyase